MAPLPPSLVACGRSHQLGPRAGDWLLRITSQLLQDTPAMLGSKPLAEVVGGGGGGGRRPWGSVSSEYAPWPPSCLYCLYPPPRTVFSYCLPSAICTPCHIIPPNFPRASFYWSSHDLPPQAREGSRSLCSEARPKRRLPCTRPLPTLRSSGFPRATKRARRALQVVGGGGARTVYSASEEPCR